MSEPKGRGVAWTPSSPPNPAQERGTSDEGRRRLKAPRRRASDRASRPQLIKIATITVLLLFVLFGFPQLLSLYYIDTMTQVTVYSMVTLALGVLVGWVGLVSLGQVAVLAIGAWVAARLLFATTQPYPVVLLEAGLITMVAGVLIGLPALRLRGLYLALITLMFAGAITVVLATVNFPNGGHGFTGYNGSLVHIPPIRRPSIASSDPAYFRYAVIVAILMFALVLAHTKTKPGRAWAAIRQSEPAALAAGINTTLYKLWAFALASFITGVAGGVLAGAVHYLYSIGFPTQDSITLLAVTLMGGVYSMWGAVVAALLYQFLPALLNNWGVSADWLTILFGLGVLQVLTTAPAGLADQVPKDLARLGRLLRTQTPKAGHPEHTMIEVEGLTVRYGGVTSLDAMSLTFEQGTCGLIGPNGAGKTTFFNVLSGFVRPAAGTVRAFGVDLLSMAHFRRARWGVRRTFQTEQAIEELSVFDNVAMVHEHSKLGPATRKKDVLDAIDFTGLDADPDARVRTLTAGQRRLVEVARAVVGQPRLVLLDEPAAGLPDEETSHLGDVIRAIPEHTGALTILVDHDMSLVSACCATTAVLDFGKLIASGPTAAVLRNDDVIRAYLGVV